MIYFLKKKHKMGNFLATLTMFIFAVISYSIAFAISHFIYKWLILYYG
jgi:hypothetical protein